MNEKEIESIFYKLSSQLVKLLGNKPLTNHDLDKVASELFGSKYHGTYSQDLIKFKNGFSITNVDTAEQKGSHWVALYQTKKTIYVFDSFGRKTSKLLPILTRNATRLKLKVVESDYDQNQSNTSVICGHLCVSYLICIKKYGIKNALKI